MRRLFKPSSPQGFKLSAKGVYRKANGGTAQIGRRFWHIKLN
nr:MAG TPA: hypothetical protein [Caudoviricetes sp.]